MHDSSRDLVLASDQQQTELTKALEQVGKNYSQLSYKRISTLSFHDVLHLIYVIVPVLKFPTIEVVS